MELEFCLALPGHGACGLYVLWAVSAWNNTGPQAEEALGEKRKAEPLGPSQVLWWKHAGLPSGPDVDIQPSGSSSGAKMSLPFLSASCTLGGLISLFTLVVIIMSFSVALFFFIIIIIIIIVQKSEECGLESAVMPLVFCPFQNRVFCLAFVVLNQSRCW